MASTKAATSEEEPGAAPAPRTLDVRLVGVSKHYGEVVAVEALDLEVKRGEFFTLLGPSGSGKTTTLRMIAGFEEPDTGRVELAGKDVTGLPPYDRAVNTVFQDYALFPHMTVGENVAYGLRVEGRRQGGAAAAARRGARDGAPGRLRRPQAGRALRRPAAAGRAGARDRQPAQGAAARRAARRPRPEAARADAGRAEDDPGRGRDHLRLRHPRPGRGADDVRPDRRLQRGPDRAGRRPRPRSTSSPDNAFVAGFVGVSNLLERDGRRFTVRPEKISHARERHGARADCTPSRGRSRTSPTPGWSPATPSTSTQGESFNSSARTWRRPRRRPRPSAAGRSRSDGDRSRPSPSRERRKEQ